MGHRVCVGEAAACALRVLGPGNQTVFSGNQRAARHVPRGRDALRHLDTARRRAQVASRRALLQHPRPRGQSHRAVLSRPLCAAVQARRRVDGRCHYAAAQRSRHPDAGRLSQLQLCRAGRRNRRPKAAGIVHARRGDHAVPRIRPRPAPSADARRRTRRVGHQRRGVGRGRTAQPVHGKFLLGMGCALAADAPRGYRRPAAARAVRQNARGEEFPERPADGAADRILAVRPAPALSTSIRAAAPRRRICSTMYAARWP